jgi:hypothetical protein
MATFAETVASQRPQKPIAQLILAVQCRRDVEIGHRDDYVTVRAGSGGAIAMFAHPDRVAICVVPERAYALEGQKPFRHQIPRTPVTSYVIVTAKGVRKHFGAVLDLAVDSVDWRAAERTGAFCARCGVGCTSKLDACPNCWTEVDEQGRCLCHQDAPAPMRLVS